MDEVSCDFCSSEVDKVYHTTSPSTRHKEADLCWVCYTSFCGNAYFYPEQSHDAEVLRVMSQHTNLLLKAILNPDALRAEMNEHDDN